ncbi:MAG: alpha/beta fold hydrolase [Chlamydiota bacterium]
MITELPFEPYPLLQSPHQQTFFGSFVRWEQELSSVTHYVSLPDGDILSIEISTPILKKDQNPVVILLHGICGDQNSSCLVRLAHKLDEKGFQVVRMNLRNCGKGRGLSKKLYHGGLSNDLFEVVRYVQNHFLRSPITIIGFSLGGNIALKLAGEKGTLEGVSQIIAINPPIDLLSIAKGLEKPENKRYLEYFLKHLIAEVHFLDDYFKNEKHSFPESPSFFDYDKIYTAPMYGFANALEYYSQSSSKRVLHKIENSCKILFSYDDPIIDPQIFHDLSIPLHIELYATRKGGHLGFIGKRNSVHPSIFWLDHLLMDWIE